ncbi:MAG: hypothetical protein H0U73_10625 [Tatlockia sp.]|nr:hypothetical protein [Tatlockia sp.]
MTIFDATALIDEALEDYPQSALWRVQTDGWQAVKGPKNFRPQFYAGMNAGFDFLRKNDRKTITPELIEGIYQSVYQYEDNYETDDIARKGYNEVSGAFEIFLPEPGLEHEAGVSLAGIPEVTARLQKAVQRQGNRPYPFLELIVERFQKPTLVLNPFSETFEQDLIYHLENATLGKEEYTGDKERPGEDKLSMVSFSNIPTERAEIINLVQQDINDFYEELSLAKTMLGSDEERKIADLNAINHFITKLHDSHYFPDGNGRTFIFLLSFALLLQNGHGLKIIEHPAHFAGYSNAELLAETEADLAHFNAYKITAAKNFLSGLDSTDIIDHITNITAELNLRLSTDPMIAMAQIDELFCRINDNKMVVPRTYNPPNFNNMYNISFFGNPDQATPAHTAVLNLLKTMYMQKLYLLAEQAPNVALAKQIGFGCNQGAQAVLMDIVDLQQISKHCDQPQLMEAISTYEVATLQERAELNII